MSSMSLELPLPGGKAKAVIFEERGQWGLYLADGAKRPIGKGVALNRAQVAALRTCDPKWQASMIWALLGYGKRGPRKPLAMAMCHPGTGRMA